MVILYRLGTGNGSMEHHHRKKTCDVRPAYRDGRREKAVKVYTINQESRYILIQGVPDIKVTEELLKLFSLYGTIQEYQILEDFPAEAFTKVLWVKYADLQAARVAKRKMDDRPFYGGTLHMSYAPEYESVEDTRCKLQARRKDVARRLRKLRQESSETAFCAGHGNPSTSATQDSDPRAVKSGSQTPPRQDSTLNQLIGPRRPDSTFPVATKFSTDSYQSADGSSGDHCEEIPQWLPPPPKPLPAWEWENPVTSRDQYPRLPTAHATLPRNFNPYPDGHEPNRAGSLRELPSQEASTLKSQLTNTAADTDREPVKEKWALDFCKTGARPKFKRGHERQSGINGAERTAQPPRLKFLECVAWRGDGKNRGRLPSNETATRDEPPGDTRTCPTTLKRPRPDQFPNPSTRVSDHIPPDRQTSSFVPRQLLGKRKRPFESSQPDRSGFGLCTEGGVLHSDRASGGDTAGESGGGQLPEVTWDSSFDRTVQSIRQQMRHVARVPSNPASPVRRVEGAQRVQLVQQHAPATDGVSAAKRLRI